MRFYWLLMKTIAFINFCGINTIFFLQKGIIYLLNMFPFFQNCIVLWRWVSLCNFVVLEFGLWNLPNSQWSTCFCLQNSDFMHHWLKCPCGFHFSFQLETILFCIPIPALPSLFSSHMPHQLPIQTLFTPAGGWCLPWKIIQGCHNLWHDLGPPLN